MYLSLFYNVFCILLSAFSNILVLLYLYRVSSLQPSHIRKMRPLLVMNQSTGAQYLCFIFHFQNKYFLSYLNEYLGDNCIVGLIVKK